MFDWMLARKLDRIGRKANPDAAFVRSLKQRIVGKPRSVVSHWKKAAVGSITSASLLLLGTGAFAYSSDVVLPDHPLYPVRQTLEKVEVKLSFTLEQKAKVQLDHLERRLKEQQLLNKSNKPIDPARVKRFVGETEAEIDAVGSIPGPRGAELDQATAKVEQDFAATLVQAKEQTKDDTEKEKINSMLDEQTDAIEAHVKKLHEKRQKHFKGVIQRHQELHKEDAVKTDAVRIDARTQETESQED